MYKGGLTPPTVARVGHLVLGGVNPPHAVPVCWVGLTPLSMPTYMAFAFLYLYDQWVVIPLRGERITTELKMRRSVLHNLILILQVLCNCVFIQQMRFVVGVVHVIVSLGFGVFC